MTLIRVGRYVINTDFITHVDLFFYDGYAEKDVIVYLKYSEESAEEQNKKEFRFKGKDANALRNYFSDPKSVTIISKDYDSEILG
jgi:hypothetical protein